MTDAQDTGFRQRALALAEAATCPTWLADYRARALRALAATSFPERKTEAWKYTSLHALAASASLDVPALLSREPVGNAPVLDAWRVVVVNGRLDATQSALPADGSLVVDSLVTLADAEQPVARELLTLGDDAPLPFATANGASFSDGVLVRVRRGTAVAKPLHVIFHATGSAPSTVQARLLVRVEEQAALTLVEQYTGNGPEQFTNAATTLDLARDAKLVHVRLQFEDSRQYFIGSLLMRQQAGSRCNGWYLMTGGRLKRNDVSCRIDGPGAELALNGAWLVGRDEHADNQVRLDHAMPHGTSTQQFKGIVGANGRAVFNGRIHIHPGARQTSADLVNNNLLLSAEAEVDTKPELEIYNDDVKCSHGATVGQLNETGVFYLQSRGIAKQDAELMLSLGFVNALVDTVPVPGIADWVRGEFSRWFTDRSGRDNGDRA